MNEPPTKFFQKLDRASERALNLGFWRINFASAIQPRKHNQMPGIVSVCSGIVQQFRPERIRVVQLAPDKDAQYHSQLSVKEVDGLRALDVEVVSIDARMSSRPIEAGNIRILADYFDFS